jgi:uncharacterized protein (UPF0332 family)
MRIEKNTGIKNELYFQTQVTLNQFISIGEKIRKGDIVNEILNNSFFKNKIQLHHNPDLKIIGQYMRNSWNTENVLNLNKLILENSNNSFIVQWGIPQTYYSIFTSLLSFYKSMGYPQESHTGVLKRYGELIEENKFPNSISMYLTGTKRNKIFVNIDKPNGLRTLDFNIRNLESIDNKICQLLNSTREFKLSESGKDFKRNTKDKVKKLNDSQLKEISKNVGNTTILDFLYRKRIKSNYQDTETFTSELLDGKTIIDELCHMVYNYNLITETYICKRIGKNVFQKIVESQLKLNGDQIFSNRVEIIKSLNS